MTAKILLVGAGNIGRRHLQAMLRLPTETAFEISIVEPSEEGRAATRKVLEAAATDPLRVAHLGGVSITSTLDEADNDFDLAVLATGAGPRRAIFDALEARGGARAYLFEKVLFVTRRDLTEVGHRLAVTGARAHVNCARRLFPAYAALKNELAGLDGIRMRVSGSRWGLGSNGIHFLDLMSFVGGGKLESVSEAAVSGDVEQSKHSGCVELFGTLHAQFSGAGQAELTCLRDPGEPVSVEFAAGGRRWTISEGAQTLTRTAAAGQTDVERFPIPYVSDLWEPHAALTSGGACPLPSYAESAHQHEMFIDAVRRRLGVSLDEDAACPIT